MATMNLNTFIQPLILLHKYRPSSRNATRAKKTHGKLGQCNPYRAQAAVYGVWYHLTGTVGLSYVAWSAR